jgi:hypothetical protein
MRRRQWYRGQSQKSVITLAIVGNRSSPIYPRNFIGLASPLSVVLSC